MLILPFNNIHIDNKYTIQQAEAMKIDKQLKEAEDRISAMDSKLTAKVHINLYIVLIIVIIYDVINNKQDQEIKSKQAKIMDLEQEIESMKELEKNIKIEKGREIQELQREIEKVRTEKEEDNKSNEERIEKV